MADLQIEHVSPENANSQGHEVASHMIIDLVTLGMALAVIAIDCLSIAFLS
jgi:hypothetical protein